MLMLIARRLAQMVAIMIVVSIILFVIFEANKMDVAGQVLGPYTSEDQRQSWLEQQGYMEPAVGRYFEWVGGVLQGNFGYSIEKRVAVADILWDRLRMTGILGFWLFLLLIPLSLLFGVLAGIKEGSFRDRAISMGAVVTTSIPEFASATFLTAIFVFWLDILPGTSGMHGGFDPMQLIMPVGVLLLYGGGYVIRMTRASMAEVMESQYIRTAILKGLPYKRVIMKHALRNALIAPFTVIMLQLNYLLSGVIVVEVFFGYRGFGTLLLDAALFGDIFVIQACTLVAVFVAVLSYFLSDIGYTLLNPRIRVS